ncbi:hypothetical protein JZU71_02685 [bacterium]|nr:hypothetical protein [bacterium]
MNKAREDQRTYTQPELIEADIPIAETRLIAVDSPRQAYYRVAIFWLPGSGYRIEKASGAHGCKPNAENFWRPNLRAALEKKSKLVIAKLKKKRGRIYVDVGAGSELK